VLKADFPTATWQGVAIDGKTLRGSADGEADLPALQVLNAMVHSLGVILQSQAIPVRTNELGTIQSFLEKSTTTA